jgi:uncharacterized damage-inducible protein DinB
MPTSDPMQILLAHDKWATHQMLNACASLSGGQFHQRFAMGRGSLHDNTTHIVGAMRFLGDLLAGRELRPRIEGTTFTVPELLAILEQATADFSLTAHAHPLDGLVTRERDGTSHTFTRGAMHHRAQCLNMLRQLGISPLPRSSVMEWAMVADGT